LPSIKGLTLLEHQAVNPGKFPVLLPRASAVLPQGLQEVAKLTKRVVDSAEARGRDYFIWCDELPRFGLRVFGSGRKSYVVQYRDATGRSRRVALGSHGPLTTDQARKKALKYPTTSAETGTMHTSTPASSCGAPSPLASPLR